jgi:RHS repeat-associated protein
MTSDGARTFEWDARNQLIGINVGTHRSEFAYDGEQRLVRTIEKESGVVQSDTRVLWCETAICEERGADGITVVRRVFGLGEQVSGQGRSFTTDHLGSVRAVTDTLGVLLAHYAFDPWGRRTILSGTDLTSVGFTGHLIHLPSALSLALYRSYDAGIARWASKDPLGDVDGPNRYAYVANNPLNRVDPLGLQLSWLLPGTRNETNKGIQDAWLSCLRRGDRRVYWKSTSFNPVVRPQDWKKWKADFSTGCWKNPSPGYVRYATCSEARGYGGSTGYCICCECASK